MALQFTEGLRLVTLSHPCSLAAHLIPYTLHFPSSVRDAEKKNNDSVRSLRLKTRTHGTEAEDAKSFISARILGFTGRQA